MDKDGRITTSNENSFHHGCIDPPLEAIKNKHDIVACLPIKDDNDKLPQNGAFHLLPKNMSGYKAFSLHFWRPPNHFFFTHRRHNKLTVTVAHFKNLKMSKVIALFLISHSFETGM